METVPLFPLLSTVLSDLVYNLPPDHMLRCFLPTLNAGGFIEKLPCCKFQALCVSLSFRQTYILQMNH